MITGFVVANILAISAPVNSNEFIITIVGPTEIVVHLKEVSGVCKYIDPIFLDIGSGRSAAYLRSFGRIFDRSSEKCFRKWVKSHPILSFRKKRISNQSSDIF